MPMTPIEPRRRRSDYERRWLDLLRLGLTLIIAVLLWLTLGAVGTLRDEIRTNRTVTCAVAHHEGTQVAACPSR